MFTRAAERGPLLNAGAACYARFASWSYLSESLARACAGCEADRAALTAVPAAATASPAPSLPTVSAFTSGAADPRVVITEGGATVWAAGAFVPGTPGVSAGAVGPDGASVVFAVGSGTYEFKVVR